jgi:acetolactate synthase-1/2/3 large subunit
LAIDSDVPWIYVTSKPAPDAEIYGIDIDPLKSQMPMWHIPARRYAAANSRLALAQITGYLRDHGLADPDVVTERRTDVPPVMMPSGRRVTCGSSRRTG